MEGRNGFPVVLGRCGHVDLTPARSPAPLGGPFEGTVNRKTQKSPEMSQNGEDGFAEVLGRHFSRTLVLPVLVPTSALTR